MSAGHHPGGSAAGSHRGGFLDAPVPRRLLPALGVFGVLITLFLVYRYGSFGLIFLPAVVLGAPLLAARFLTNPAPVVAFYLLIIVNLDFFKLGGTRLTLDVLTSALLLYALVTRILLEGKRIFTTGVEKGYLLFLGLTFISVLLSVNVPASVKNWGRDLEYLFLFSFLYGLDLSPRHKRMIVGGALFSSVIPCILGLFGLLLGISRFLGVETPVEGGKDVVRIAGTLSHPVVFSHHLSFVTVVAIALFWDGTWIKRRYLGALITLQLVVLYLTYGRTGWGEFAAGIVCLFWLLGYRKVVFLVIPAVAFALFKIVPNFAGRVENALQSNDNSLLWRFGLWAYAITLFPRRPIFGSGPGTFLDYVSYREGFNAHQTWLNLLIETGIVGCLAFIVLMVVTGRALAAKRRSSPEVRDPLVTGVYAGWVGLLAGSMVGNPFGLPAASIYFWALLAVALRPDPPEGKDAESLPAPAAAAGAA